MSKNIVIFFDSSSFEGGKGNNTNVFKLCNIVEHRTMKQIQYYDSGTDQRWGSIAIINSVKNCYRFMFEACLTSFTFLVFYQKLQINW